MNRQGMVFRFHGSRWEVREYSVRTVTCYRLGQHPDIHERIKLRECEFERMISTGSIECARCKGARTMPIMTERCKFSTTDCPDCGKNPKPRRNA